MGFSLTNIEIALNEVRKEMLQNLEFGKAKEPIVVPSRESREKFRSFILKHIGMETEVWALHPDTDRYLFSQFGRVKSLAYNRLMSSFPNDDGYIMTNISFNNGKRLCRSVHRFVMETFLSHFDNSSSIMEVNHIDGNKTNNRLDNLEWVTREENLQHARDNKLFKSFSRDEHPNTKIFTKEFSTIKELYSLGFSKREIAKSYNVDRNVIINIFNLMKEE